MGIIVSIQRCDGRTVQSQFEKRILKWHIIRRRAERGRM